MNFYTNSIPFKRIHSHITSIFQQYRSGQIRLTFFILSVLTLSGCSSINDMPDTQEATINTTPEQWQSHHTQVLHLTNWTISGKVGVVSPSQSQTGYIDWQQNQQSFAINIRGTLGFGGLDLFGDHSWVTIKVDENNQRTLPTEIALTRYLDWEFPINALTFWIKGIPAPDLITDQQSFNNQGHLAQLKQQGWDIRLMNYERHTDAKNTTIYLPHKVIARYNGHKVSLIISDWALNSTP